MNTVSLGNKFEEESYDIIVSAVNNNEFGISGSTAKVYKKKGYYSRDREKDIIFDLSIEVWPENADRFTLLYLIECKNYSAKKVPVDDVEEFYSKVIQVAGINVKGVMLTNNSYQEGGLVFARNKGMMLIEVNEDGNHDIILHKTQREKKENIKNDIDVLFEKFIHRIFGSQIIKGLKRLSSTQIEGLANSIHSDYSNIPQPIVLDDLLYYLGEKYNIKFNFDSQLEVVNNKCILGCYFVKENTIYIDESNLLKNQLTFILGHELGHFFLHKELEFNQEKYNDFTDSEYNFFVDKYVLKNDKNWIEWQANRFSISLFLPRDPFIYHFNMFRKNIGISKYRHIYLDDQPINQFDFKRTVDYLSNLFNVSKKAVRYRIEEFDLITYAGRSLDLNSQLRKYIL